jgi:hypothetical protein
MLVDIDIHVIRSLVSRRVTHLLKMYFKFGASVMVGVMVQPSYNDMNLEMVQIFKLYRRLQNKLRSVILRLSECDDRVTRLE